MDEREKIINILQSVKYCDTNNRCEECKYDKESERFTDMSCGSLRAADALIAANIGDVTAYKAEAEYWEKICKFEGDEYHTTIKNAAEHARHLMQERDEWKERAEKEKTEKNKWKCTANDWKQRFESREKQLAELRTTSCEAVIRKDRVISEQKSEIDRLSTERDEYKHRAEVVERALFNMTKKYMLAERIIATTKDGQLSFGERLIALFAGDEIKQAEREIEEEKK